MRSPRLVFLDRATLDADDIDFSPLEEIGTVTYHPLTHPEDTVKRIHGAEIVLTNKVVIDEAAIAAAPDLKMIQVAATGYNNVDLDAARARGIAVCNVSGYSSPSVTQHTFALILNLLSKAHIYATEAPLWADSPIFTRLDHSISEASGKVLGIVGLGSIGRAVANVGEAMGMHVVGLAREDAAASTDDFERMRKDHFFAKSDIISLHCPLTEHNRHLINPDTLGQMKSSSILINTGRGALIDETALAEALKTGSIAGAGLDVLSTEPPPADHPLLDSSIPNLIITPHTAWASVESRRRLLVRIVENVNGFIFGERLNRVD